MTYIVKTFQNETEWLENRVIGGSSASAILGVNPYMSKLDLFKKIKGIKEKHNDTVRTIYGKTLEPLLRQMFQIDNPRLKVIEPNNHELYIREDKPFMTATIDSTIITEEGEKGILEIKTHLITSREDAEEWNRSHPPVRYYIQCLHYLLVLDDYEFFTLYAKVDYAGHSVIKSWTFHRKEIKKDLEQLEKCECDFWENYIEKDKMPSITIKL